MYAQKAIVHNAHTLHTVRNVHNAHCAYRFKVQSCDCINFVRAIETTRSKVIQRYFMHPAEGKRVSQRCA